MKIRKTVNKIKIYITIEHHYITALKCTDVKRSSIKSNDNGL